MDSKCEKLKIKLQGIQKILEVGYKEGYNLIPHFRRMFDVKFKYATPETLDNIKLDYEGFIVLHTVETNTVKIYWNGGDTCSHPI